MSDHFYLNWATTAVSLFNTIILLWLGSTVMLNADRRRWGIWLAGGGLLLGGAFFVSHTAILGLELTHLSRSLRFWSYLSLIPVVVLPLAWYVVMLWYAGYSYSSQSHLHQRHKGWLLAILIIAGTGLFMVIIYANPLPERLSLLPFRFVIQNLGGTVLLGSGYAAYLLLCFGLALDALLRPGPTERVMGDLARERARIWLVAVSLLLLLVSIVVIGVLLWTLFTWNLFNQGRTYFPMTTESILSRLTYFDLFISSLIAVAIVALGQAVVAYEIFTGKTLPRRGLRRQWHRAILLAAGYGVLVAWTLTSQQPVVYSVVLSAVLMTLAFALLSWRSYAERERYIDHLRPFVSSQRLYDHLVTSARPLPQELDAAALFHTLCADVLGVDVAYLVPQGPLAPLAGPPLSYPRAPAMTLPPLSDVASRFTSARTLCLPVDAKQFAGATWAIPLWSERGLIGVLLLGDKRDGGIYTQEEIEIARASGERLVDTQASAEMAQRLLALQRQRLAENQVADRRTRRILHDDVLPQVHAAILALSDGRETGLSRADVLAALTGVHRQLSDLLRDTQPVITPEVARLGVLGALRRSVEKEFENTFEEVTWDVPAELEERARQLPPLAAEVLFYAAREVIRNAARHARGGNDRHPLHLRVCANWDSGGLELEVEDNGVGVDAPAPNGHDGGGLALHSTMLAVVGGMLSLDSVPDAYTRVSLVLPDEALRLG